MLKKLQEEFAIAEAENHNEEQRSGARKKEKDQDLYVPRKIDSYRFGDQHCHDSNFESTSNPMSRFHKSSNNLPWGISQSNVNLEEEPSFYGVLDMAELQKFFGADEIEDLKELIQDQTLNDPNL